jgi:hypothetical protein
MCLLSRRQWFGGLLGFLAGWLARPSRAKAESRRAPVLAKNGVNRHCMTSYDTLGRPLMQITYYDDTWHMPSESSLNSFSTSTVYEYTAKPLLG